MYGKLVNGEIISAPEKMLQYEYKGKHICAINPTKENCIQAGYKIMKFEQLSESKDNEVIYEETEDEIIVKHSLKEAE